MYILNNYIDIDLKVEKFEGLFTFEIIQKYLESRIDSESAPILILTRIIRNIYLKFSHICRNRNIKNCYKRVVLIKLFGLKVLNYP